MSQSNSKRVLFGTSSWGLGHATRDLILMKGLIERGCDLTVVSTGKALAVIRSELGDSCRYLDWPDIPSSVARTSLGFYAKTVANIPRIISAWEREKRLLGRLLRRERFDLIVSDHRNGLVREDVPSYYITHSPHYIAPWRSRFMEGAMEWFLTRWFSPVRRILIPDDEDGGMSGEMSHGTWFLPQEKLVYLGILSSVRRREDLPEDIDYFITVSGPEPQRTLFARRILSQLDRLGGRIVVALGTPGGSAPQVRDGVEIYPYLDRARQEEMLNRARLVVCRSGYTTLMELAELGKRALIVPTPGQSEQEYLAKTLRERGIFYSVRQNELDLGRDTEIAKGYSGYTPAHPTARSVDRFLEVVLDGG